VCSSLARRSSSPPVATPASRWLRGCGTRLQADPDHARDHELERRRVLAAFGANLVLTPGPRACRGPSVAPRPRPPPSLIATFLPQQFKTPQSPLFTRDPLGRDLEGHRRSHRRAGFGRGYGGTITESRATSRKQEEGHHLGGREPAKSPVLTSSVAASAQTRAAQIQGIGAGFVPTRWI